MLPHLHIQNFRQFRDLKIDGLRRMNLIVGENGVGKSSVLEAVWLFAQMADAHVMLDILHLRGELSKSGMYMEAPKDFSRSAFSTFSPWPLHSAAEGCYFSIESEPTLPGFCPNHRSLNIEISFSKYSSGKILIKNIYKVGGRNYAVDATVSLDGSHYKRLFQSKRGDNVFVPVSGLDSQFVQEFWDRINLTESEDDIDNAVRLLEPDIQRISMSSTGPVVKMRGAPAPVPLRRLGEGMVRLFALALAMVNAKGGVLLIDEIETGLHRATLNRMWPFLFTLAERLNVQLFATTHSWDCISSFAAAGKATPEDDAALIRLERKGGDIVAVHYDEKTLAIATEQGIEVR